MTAEIVVLDSSVLINFLVLNRADLLRQHPYYSFWITDHVRKEITRDYPQQVERLEQALQQGWIQQTALTNEQEITIFGQLALGQRLGAGECAAIAAAIHQNGWVALDDKVARKEARKISRTIKLIDTQTLIVSMIQQGLLSIEAADVMKTVWEKQYRFRLKLNSFADLLGQEES